MNKYLFLLSLLFAPIAAFSQSQSQVIEVDEDEGDDGSYDDGYYDDGVVWSGPGYYYGAWFNNETDYVIARRNYYWREGRGAYRGDGYRGGGGGYRGGRGGGRR
ncbi:MAG: hypothetical protein JSS30_03650 [Verrucomicrobia bacterium]|nr:hypothetical protein [Verrucomicrobiota bacterium]